jgi:hypothetical protein
MTRTLLLVILISLVGGMFVCYQPNPGRQVTGVYQRAPTAAEVAAVTLMQPLPRFIDSTTCSPRCCNYGLWTAGDFVVLHERADSASAKSGVAKPQSMVSATTSVTHVHPARMVLTVARPPHFGAGDTLEVYSPRGDGFYRARRDKSQDELVEVQLRYLPPDRTDAGRFFGEWRHTWWVFVSGPDGQGWTAETRKFSGPRSCSAPPRRTE